MYRRGRAGTFSKPDAAVGMGDHGARLRVMARDIEFAHRAVHGDAADPVAGSLAEPERAVAHHDRQRLAALRNAGLEFRDLSIRGDAANLAHFGFREPDIAVRPEGDAVGSGVFG